MKRPKLPEERDDPTPQVDAIAYAVWCRDMLTKHQRANGGMCPECGEGRPYHSDECELAALIFTKIEHLPRKWERTCQ